MNTLKKYWGLNVLWYSAIIFTFYSYTWMVFDTYQQTNSLHESFKMAILFLLIYSSLGIPFFYFTHQLKSLINESKINGLFSYKIANYFKRMSYCIYTLNIFTIGYVIYLTHYPTVHSTTESPTTIVFENTLATIPFRVFSSYLSPIIPMLIITVLGYTFYVIHNLIINAVMINEELKEVI